jgi:hypothetical protein
MNNTLRQDKYFHDTPGNGKSNGEESYNTKSLTIEAVIDKLGPQLLTVPRWHNYCPS